jgi:hypothetical protein
MTINAQGASAPIHVEPAFNAQSPVERIDFDEATCSVKLKLKDGWFFDRPPMEAKGKHGGKEKDEEVENKEVEVAVV